jgi:tripeptidyl-peptidase-1
MLLNCVLAVLAGGLVLEAAGRPLASSLGLKKREVPPTHVQYERHLPYLTRRWTKREKLLPEATIPMRIGLKQFNVEAGHDRLLEISQQDSPNYGKHMSPEEVIDFFAPPQSTVNAVIDWIVANGIAKERVGHSTNKQVGDERRYSLIVYTVGCIPLNLF